MKIDEHLIIDGNDHTHSLQLLTGSLEPAACSKLLLYRVYNYKVQRMILPLSQSASTLSSYCTFSSPHTGNWGSKRKNYY